MRASSVFSQPSRPVQPRITLRCRGRKAAIATVLSIGATLTLSGCSEPVEVAPAENAADARCSQVMITLPQEISGQPKRKTTSQSTAAWGSPASAILKCGEIAPAVTSDRCSTLDEVDWTARENNDGTWTIATYGREPYITITIDTARISSSDVAVAVSDAVKNNKATKRCTSARDLNLEAPEDADEDVVSEGKKNG